MPYVELPPPHEDTARALAGYDPLLVKLLARRNITTKEEADTFLNPNYDTQLHDPFLLTDMDRAADRVLRAIKNKERILIYSDYDCDGIPGGVLLHDFFSALGHTTFSNYIPHRHQEGYGFNLATVPSFKEAGYSLIITVDCGITDHEAVARAAELGIDVIVTDHHEPSETLPKAFAVINPKRDRAYPFDGICGAAVAFKLVQGVLARGRASGEISLPAGKEKWLLDLVGIATIADMMPLVDESRVFARYGLTVLRKSQRPGLQQLLRKAGGNQRYLTEDDIGFTIAPRINAASRMDNPEDAFHMLRTRDEAEAGSYVAHLEKLNNERKGVVAHMTRVAREKLEQRMTIPQVIVMGDPEWRPSLVGLVAHTLAEEHMRPVFLWGRDGKGIIKGSCRSGNGTSVVSLMTAAQNAFMTCGGHHASGGFSVHHDDIHGLEDALVSAYQGLSTQEAPSLHAHMVDAVLSPDMITDSLYRTLDVLAPFGPSNPKPVFAITPAYLVSVAVFGKTRNHTKLRFRVGDAVHDAVAFFQLPETFSREPRAHEEVTIIGHLEKSFFMGRMESRVRLIDVV
jgi:single-stranded-DNA-specific exonuclease